MQDQGLRILFQNLINIHKNKITIMNSNNIKRNGVVRMHIVISNIMILILKTTIIKNNNLITMILTAKLSLLFLNTMINDSKIFILLFKKDKVHKINFIKMKVNNRITTSLLPLMNQQKQLIIFLLPPSLCQAIPPIKTLS